MAEKTRVVRIRIQGDNEQDTQDARRLLEIITQEAVKLQKPREGTNPKYEGRQKWASYGELKIERLLFIVDQQPATGATIRVAKPKNSTRKRKQP